MLFSGIIEEESELGYITKVVGRDLIFLLDLLSLNSDKWFGGNHHISAAESGFLVCNKLLFV
jgi:hypothetical protein